MPLSWETNAVRRATFRRARLRRRGAPDAKAASLSLQYLTESLLGRICGWNPAAAEITDVLQPLFAVERLVANKAGWQAPSRPSSRRRRGPKASLDGACHPAILGSPRATVGCTCGCIRRTDAYGRLLEARSEPRLFRGRMAVPWHHTRSRRDGIDANTRKPSSYGISFAFEASWSACRLTFGAPTHPQILPRTQLK